VQLVGIDPATYPQVSGLEFTSGNEAAAYAELAAGRALISNGIFAAQNNVKVGDTLTLKTPEGDRQYRVVGIGLDYLNAKLATSYISQANLAADFHQTADLLLMANKKPEADVNAVRVALENVLKEYPAFTLISGAEWRESQYQTFFSAMWLFYVMMFVLSIPSLLAMINTLAINVMERTREIGVIRAVGATRGQVQRIVLAESLLLAATGIAFGILAGLWLGYVMVGAMNVSGFKLPYYFPYNGILAAIAVGLIFGVAAAVLPARQAARLEIVTALHYE
jgi:putative ABC transport system permease protein